MKNKMKKLFSKITVLVLLVSMIIPYTNIPKVEAATEDECNGEWEYHTNYYFFLAAENPFGWLQMFKDNNSTAVTYYSADFLYTFPKEKSTIDFDCEDCSSGFVEIVSGNASSTFNPSDEESREQWTTGDFYKQLKNEEMQNISVTELDHHVFTTGSGTESDRIITYLFHGDYSYLGTTNSWTSVNGLLGLNDIVISDESLETTKKSVTQLSNASIPIDKSTITASAIGPFSNNYKNNLNVKDLQDAILSYNNGGNTYGIIKYNNTYNQSILNVVIKRQYKLSDIIGAYSTVTDIYDNKNSECDADGNNCKDAGLVNGTYNGTNVTFDLPSAEGERIGIIGQSTKVGLQKTIAVNNDRQFDSQEQFLLSPTLYQMSYRVCKDSGKNENQVTLSYNGNESSVNSSDKAENMPSDVTKTKGSKFTTSDKTPTLKGYKFDSWNVSPKCNGESFEANYELPEALENDLPLYACWKSTDGTKGPGTGVLTYTGLFGGIIALAGGSYYIMKKKNLFKQI